MRINPVRVMQLVGEAAKAHRLIQAIQGEIQSKSQPIVGFWSVWGAEIREDRNFRGPANRRREDRAMINRLILALGCHTDRIKCTHKSGARDAISRRGRKGSSADLSYSGGNSVEKSAD